MRWGGRLKPNNLEKRQKVVFAFRPVIVKIGDFGEHEVYEWLWFENYIACQEASDGYWYTIERKAN